MSSGGLVIIGASGHGRVALDIALAAGHTVLGLVDRGRESGGAIHGAPLLAREPEDCAELTGGADWFVAVGDNRVREDLFARMRGLTGREPLTLIHPSAAISPRAVLGEGVFVAPGVVVNIDARVGDGVILNTGATIDHDVRLGDFVQISPGCHLAGNVTVGARGFLGAGTSVVPGVTIGADAVVGAGAAVVRDVAGGIVVVGVPAREK
jgi:sugar O-acyltransferase (sialic acid O-acetyltransferase NeuD family)